MSSRMSLRRAGVVPWIALTLAGMGCKDLPRNFPRLTTAADSAPEAADPPKAADTRTKRKTPAVSGDRSLDSEYFAHIRQNLRALVAAEEAFYAENGAYSDDFSFIRFRPEHEVEVRFLWVTPEGWAASGTHPQLDGRDCVTFVGRAQAPPTTLKYVRSGREGVVICDEPGRPSPPAAQAPAPDRPDTANALASVAPAVAMKVDLRNLVQSQRTYFAMQGIYARRTEPLALQYLWHPGVRVKILSADAQSWAAKATHSRFPGRSCVIWVGAVPDRPVTERQGLRADAPGVPVCDR
jgi:hypothetical protein